VQPLRSPRRTWVLGGGGARGAAQVGAIQALFEAGVEPPARLIGVSVGALNAAILAAFPSPAGAAMLRALWRARTAREVFRAHPLAFLLARLRRQLSALPASNVTRLIERDTYLAGVERFEDLEVPLSVVATDVAAGRRHVFERGLLQPALQASCAIPGVFPAVEIDGRQYVDGGVVDNLPLTLAVEQGSREVLAISLMGIDELEHPPRSWSELMSRIMQLSLHHRMLSDFELVRRRARVVVLAPLLGMEDGLDMRPERIEDVIRRSREATRQLLQRLGRRLFRESGIHYLPLGLGTSASVAS
jgi:NTE family protein